MKRPSMPRAVPERDRGPHVEPILEQSITVSVTRIRPAWIGQRAGRRRWARTGSVTLDHQMSTCRPVMAAALSAHRRSTGRQTARPPCRDSSCSHSRRRPHCRSSRGCSHQRSGRGDTPARLEMGRVHVPLEQCARRRSRTIPHDTRSSRRGLFDPSHSPCRRIRRHERKRVNPANCSADGMAAGVLHDSASTVVVASVVAAPTRRNGREASDANDGPPRRRRGRLPEPRHVALSDKVPEVIRRYFACAARSSRTLVRSSSRKPRS